MVEYGSIAPGKMFLISDSHKQSFYKKSKLSKQMPVLTVKLGSSAFDIMPGTICTCWRAAILGGCVLQFEIAQMLISGPNSGTGRQSCPAAVHWMQFQARGFVPTNRLHFITHTNAIDCADQCAQRCSAPASAGFRRNYIFTKSCHGPHGP